MDIGKLSMFANLKEKMGWLSQKQETLAHNIANADTPDYRPRRLKEFNPDRVEHDRQFQLLVSQTNDAHSEGLRKPANFKDQSWRKAYEVSPNKNSVILEEQLVALQQNTVDHQTMTRLYQKHKQMMSMAVRSQG
jgi:flagellar basal-body rod protein FlgB